MYFEMSFVDRHDIHLVLPQYNLWAITLGAYCVGMDKNQPRVVVVIYLEAITSEQMAHYEYPSEN